MARTPGKQKKMTEWGQWSRKTEWSKPQNGTRGSEVSDHMKTIIQSVND